MVALILVQTPHLTRNVSFKSNAYIKMDKKDRKTNVIKALEHHSSKQENAKALETEQQCQNNVIQTASNCWEARENTSYDSAYYSTSDTTDGASHYACSNRGNSPISRGPPSISSLLKSEEESVEPTCVPSAFHTHEMMVDTFSLTAMIQRNQNMVREPWSHFVSPEPSFNAFQSYLNSSFNQVFSSPFHHTHQQLSNSRYLPTLVNENPQLPSTARHDSPFEHQPPKKPVISHDSFDDYSEDCLALPNHYDGTTFNLSDVIHSDYSYGYGSNGLLSVSVAKSPSMHKSSLSNDCF